MSEWSNILQFNTSWLASLRTRYILDLALVFSSSCSGYDLTLIKRSHTLNLYSFFLLSVTVVAQFTANSEKAIYFLSLTSCSINKLKSHILFTCKSFNENFVFRFNVEKNILLQ